MAAEDSSKTTGVYFDKQKGRYRVHFQLSQDGARLRRSRLLPKDTTLEEARLVAESMRASALRELVGIEPRHSWQLTIERAAANKASWFHVLLKGAKQRAKAKNREFALTDADLIALLVRSGGKCEVTGLNFSDRVFGAAKMRPLIPSLDRMNSALGYTPTNCRIVCAAINIAMFNWGAEMFKSLAIGYVVNQVITPHISGNGVHLPAHLPTTDVPRGTTDTAFFHR